MSAINCTPQPLALDKEGVHQSHPEGANMRHLWQHDKDTGEHFLSLNGDESVKVYKSAAGDYVLTTHSDAHGCGGEVEYFDTLRQAKQHGEKIADGTQPDPDGKTHNPALAA